ncbi:hypothetical protein LOK49_LG10G00654 [Camellia lanceoleosa]|uniref:Uncharacterized protein n=1 Tax=Camellia lanceoleosa TaxID=1840588 RepID=A0ACC0GB48_9ERIC|nr:hypothetical protein LOK49_LG10G00654 [Camellia lanceoleosa]
MDFEADRSDFTSVLSLLEWCSMSFGRHTPLAKLKARRWSLSETTESSSLIARLLKTREPWGSRDRFEDSVGLIWSSYLVGLVAEHSHLHQQVVARFVQSGHACFGGRQKAAAMEEPPRPELIGRPVVPRLGLFR